MGNRNKLVNDREKLNDVIHKTKGSKSYKRIQIQKYKIQKYEEEYCVTYHKIGIKRAPREWSRESSVTNVFLKNNDNKK